jgi:molybdate/tungstate transport system permease protein
LIKPWSAKSEHPEKSKIFQGANNMTIIFILLGAIIFLFILVPLLKMIFASDPQILLETVLDSEVITSIGLTLYAALIATVFGFLLGVPLAYLLARFDFPGKNLVEGLIDVPIVVPHIAAGIALLFVFGRSFLVGRAFQFIGVDFFDSLAGIVIAMLFVSIPFLIDSAKEGFKKVDVRLEKVSRSLGASPWQAFFKISLPLAWRSIAAGGVMMWARGISEFAAVIILAYHPMIASTLIYERFETYGLDYARPVAVLLILVCLISFIVLRLVLYRGQKT